MATPKTSLHFQMTCNLAILIHRQRNFLGCLFTVGGLIAARSKNSIRSLCTYGGSPMLGIQNLRKVSSLFCFLLIGTWAAPAHAQNLAVTVQVDANANKRPINPLVYGVAQASSATLAELNCP
jgi:hypothetical protein